MKIDEFIDKGYDYSKVMDDIDNPIAVQMVLDNERQKAIRDDYKRGITPEKKKTIDAAINLNEELIDKDKYKINIKKEFTDVIEYRELFFWQLKRVILLFSYFLECCIKCPIKVTKLFEDGVIIS